MSWRTLWITLSVLGLVGCSCVVDNGPHALRFDADNAGRYPVGTNLREGRLDLEVEELSGRGSSGPPQFAELVSPARRRADSISLRTVNSAIHYGLPYPLTDLTMDVTSQGAIPIEVNGQARTVDRVEALVTSELPFVDITVARDSEGSRLRLCGLIRDFRLGGDDLDVRNVSYTMEQGR